MREIKFRAWHDGQMLYEDWSMNVFRTIGDILKFDTVMQYTGLKDKDGVEVYEGDIVRCSSGCPHVVEWREEIGGKFFGGMPGWYLSDLLSGSGEGYAWVGNTHDSIGEVVIGNIYENPELIADSGKETK